MPVRSDLLIASQMARTHATTPRLSTLGLLLVLLASGTAARAAGAQDVLGLGQQLGLEYGGQRYEGWTQEVQLAATNALLSGIVTGLLSMSTGEGTFSSGFAAGAAAGIISFGGKRISAERFFGAGAIGRGINGVAGSMARNAAGSEPLFSTVAFPMGPVRFEWTHANGRLLVRPDLSTIYWTTYGLFEPDLELSLRASASAGTPIFLARGARLSGAQGTMAGGVIFVSDDHSAPLGDILAHERVHVVQRDFVWDVLGAAERWAIGSVRKLGVPWPVNHLDVVLLPDLIMRTAAHLSNNSSPFELEARFLETRTVR